MIGIITKNIDFLLEQNIHQGDTCVFFDGYIPPMVADNTAKFSVSSIHDFTGIGISTCIATTQKLIATSMLSKKIYRKEDILRMTNIAVNRGWGPRGAATYSIWLYKGGGNCHHYWKRRIFKAPASDEGFVVYPDNVQDDTIVSVTKARSEGFTIKRNDNLVAKAPKTMINEGFLNPR